jgi:L-lactate dehydrogenase (cytochrome)
MIERHPPRWSEFAPLVKPARRTGGRVERRVGRAADIADLRLLARKRTPRSVFDYVDGAAGDEVSLRRSRQAFERIEFLPRVLRDVSKVSTQTTILGKASTMPFVFAPTGYTRMMHAAGESAVARVAAKAGIPYSLSTVGTTSPEDVAAASGDGRRWFQLYTWRDRERSKALLERAKAAGFDVLLLTVDVPVGGARLRDVRNGLTIPPTLTWQTFLNGAMHPRWLADFLTTPPPTFMSLQVDKSVPMSQIASLMFDPSVSFDDLDWFRQIWPGPLVIKGVQTVADAVALAKTGVDGIVVSNHGGRQLDRSVTPLELLPAVVDAVGDQLEVLMDTGIRSGADIAAALALGAKAVLVGRAYLYGLMAGGEAGVQRAYDILASELVRTMQLLGVTSIDEIDGSLLRLRP